MPVETSTCVRIAGYCFTEKDRGYIFKTQDTDERMMPVFRVSEINTKGIRIHELIPPNAPLPGLHGQLSIDRVGMWVFNGDYCTQSHHIFRVMKLDDERWEKLVDYLEMGRLVNEVTTRIEHPHVDDEA